MYDFEPVFNNLPSYLNYTNNNRVDHSGKIIIIYFYNNEYYTYIMF